jgi:type IV pilus assembly protein PilY1
MAINRFSQSVGQLLLSTLFISSAAAANTDLASSPLTTSSTSSVLPNLLFVLDDSGSMDNSYLPDWANSADITLFNNSGYNGIYYNPAVTYTPPTNYNADGTVNTSKYPSQTSWTQVKDDAYGVQRTTKSNLTTNANYYTFIVGEYCTNANLRTCVPAAVDSNGSPTAPAGYPYPATLRWCSDAALTDCQAAYIDSGAKTYTNARYPGQIIRAAATITISTANSVSSIKVNGNQILSGSTTSSTSANTVASRVATAINNCTNGTTGNCAVSGYSASASGKVVTILAPSSVGAITYPLVVNPSTGVTTTSFAGGGAIPGSNLLVNIVSSNNSYPYPGTTTKANSRTDCAGTTCTYAEEMTNYANWWTYYHTRMQTMKTAASNAFAPVGNSYRIGYMSINNNTGSDFLNIDTFSTTQKNAWYTKLTKAKPSNSTPLRAALATAGRLYANKVTSVNGISVVDPMQYACQQNFTLLSTDGYWNESSNPKRVDGSTDIGNQDAMASRPYYDGSQATSVTTSNTTTETYSTSGCSTGKKAIISTVTKLTHTVVTGAGGAVISDDAPGVTTTVSNTTVVACSSNPRSLASPTTTAPTTTVSAPVGPGNTLSDVAYYYYMTDLRTSALNNATGVLGTDVAENIVPTKNVTSSDSTLNATWQHMTTFTLGLGASGFMLPSTSYQADTSGDYYDATHGTPANPTAGICSWQNSGACNWPTPVNNEQTTVDDLWHAAVNGHGKYFSAGSPGALYNGLSDALSSINSVTSASAAATTSTQNPVPGNNSAYVSSFTSGDWTGDVVALAIDLTTGAVGTTNKWSAQTQLDSTAYTSRVLYTYDPTATYDPNGTGNGRAKLFNWTNLTASEQGFFNKPNISTLSQFCATGTICLSATDQTAASGQNLVNFISGDRSHEGPSSDPTKYYRLRTHVLGDIVNSEAVYIQAPQQSYVDSGYAAYKTAQATRQGVVYVGANDGMLHAFNADTGQELWAYIPSMVLPKLYKLADKNYSAVHQYYVDGTPVQGDVYIGGAWRTIIVGGLNGGGQGYYALDVTDPLHPKAMWEFTSDTSKTAGYVTDANLGYTFGKPEISKLKNGTWAVFVTSGYNNNTTGDGQGRLYVLDAKTGAKVSAIPNGISTGVGDADTPSGLAQIRAWANDSEHNNTTLRVYGGDLLGNVWRFDVNNDIGTAGYDAQVLATLRGPSPAANVQPITAKPELGLVGSYPVVFVPTGRYLGLTDLSDTSAQSFYAIKDQLNNTSYGSPRSDPKFVQQVLTVCADDSTDPNCPAKNRKITNNAVNFALDDGWYVDFPSTGERGNTDPMLALGTLAVVTNVPNANACTAGGFSFEYFFDYRNGNAIATSNGIVGKFLGNFLSTRAVLIKLPNNSVIAITRGSDNSTTNTNAPVVPPGGITRRVSWRELIND